MKIPFYYLICYILNILNNKDLQSITKKVKNMEKVLLNVTATKYLFNQKNRIILLITRG